ncbi:MAG: hypothetical protein LBP59_17290 [Planctomycetaceae bacterium]|nr:hypothetical protein [Planctomycetaceae bacterium]
MSTTACRRDARDPGMQAFRLRIYSNPVEVPAIIPNCPTCPYCPTCP